MKDRTPLFESLESRSLYSATFSAASAIPAIKIPGTGIDIPIDNIPGIPSTDDKNVTDVAYARRKQYGVPALAVATIKNGKLDEVAVVGTRKAGDPTRARWGDQFLIASGTKAMTATLAARLVERGYIQWTTKVVDVFPGFAKKIPAQYAQATLEQLLAHRAGFPNDLSVGLTVSSAIAPGTPREIRSNFLPSIMKLKPVGAAGSYSYSSVDYIVAGALMETKMKEAYESLMQRYVFKPLGMTSAGFGWPGSSSVLDQPRAHDALGNSYLPDAINRFPAIYNPSGGVHVSVIDWAKFIGIQTGNVPKKFLTDATVKKLRTPYPNSKSTYALGWNIVNVGPVSVIQHDGTESNWYSSVTVVPGQKTAILAVGNRGGLAGERAVHGVLSDLRSRLY